MSESTINDKNKFANIFLWVIISSSVTRLRMAMPILKKQFKHRMQAYFNRSNGKPHIWPYYSKNYNRVRFMCGVNNGTATLGDSAREAYLNWEK